MGQLNTTVYNWKYIANYIHHNRILARDSRRHSHMMLHIDIDSTVHVIKHDSCQETYTLLLRFKSLCGPALHFHLPLSTIIKLIKTSGSLGEEIFTSVIPRDSWQPYRNPASLGFSSNHMQINLSRVYFYWHGSWLVERNV